MAKITKKMGIIEILEKSPESAETMFKYGLHCVGCMAAKFESLEEGCKAHGISEKDIDKMIDEINQKIEKKKS